MKDLNRLKVVLVEQKKTGKWLAEQLGKDPSTVSKWCSNKMQPSLEMLVNIAKFICVTEKFGRLSEIVKIIAEICNMIKYGNYYGYESKYIYY